jgi:hypothetical protein
VHRLLDLLAERDREASSSAADLAVARARLCAALSAAAGGGGGGDGGGDGGGLGPAAAEAVVAELRGELARAGVLLRSADERGAVLEARAATAVEEAAAGEQGGVHECARAGLPPCP